MNRIAVVVTAVALSTLAGGMAARSAPASASMEAPERVAPAQRAFEALKALEGTWMLADELGAPTADIASIYHVTAGGSALIETMFPGAEHEMVTVYYVQDDALCMTHYCMLGNRPMLTSAAPTAEEMVFVCDEATCCGEQMHMHAATITIIDEEHVRTVWGGSEAGPDHPPTTFNLIRRADDGAER